MATQRENRTAVSSRALNPIADGERPETVFCDKTQAKATTATLLFRNPPLFKGLRTVALPGYFAQTTTRPFLIWSAGCSTGEEAYSLAMLVEAEFLRRKRRPHYQVFGTDINADHIRSARVGVYSGPLKRYDGHPLRGLIARFVTEQRRRLHIDPALRGKVRLGVFDIRKRPRRHRFDYIVCNHVLQYYDARGQLAIIANLRAVARPDGWLYLEGLTPGTVEEAGLKRHPEHRHLFSANEDCPS